MSLAQNIRPGRSNWWLFWIIEKILTYKDPIFKFLQPSKMEIFNAKLYGFYDNVRSIISHSGRFSKFFFLSSTLPKTYILSFNSILNIMLIKIDHQRPKGRSMFFPFYAFLKLLWVGLYEISPVWYIDRLILSELTIESYR